MSGKARGQDAFRRGDANRDGRIDVADCVHIIHSLSPGMADTTCLDAADIDDDGAVLLTTDVPRLLDFLYLGGSPPPAPFPDCGPDLTFDAFVLCAYPGERCAPQPQRAESPDFELRILGEQMPIVGAPGESALLGSFLVGLCNGDGGPDDSRFLVQGWSLSVASLGCTMRDPTTSATAGAESLADPVGRRNGGFEKTEVARNPGENDSGVVSAVILSFTLPVALEESAVGLGCVPHPLLRFEVEATVPPAREARTCRLLFADGLAGSGVAVANLASTAEGAFKPTLNTRALEIKGPTLEAVLDAPDQVLLLGEKAQAYLSGKRSMDHRGGTALRFTWGAAAPPAGQAPELARERAALTPISFSAPGAYEVDLTVLGGSRFALVDTEVNVISVVRPEAILPSAPAFALVDPELLAALSDRPFDLVLTLTNGSPRPSLQILGEAPAGLTLDAEGRLHWIPGRDQIGTHNLSVAASNVLGETRLELSLRVVDSFEALAHLTAQALPAGARRARLEPLQAGDGGGGGVREAPELIGDRSPFPPELTLYLQFASGSNTSSAQEVVPDDPGAGPDRFAAVRFAPQALQAGDPAGAVYRSGASASKLFTGVVEGSQDFTVELWLSRVPANQPGASGGEPAMLLAMLGDDLAEASWALGASGGRYFLRLNAEPADVELEVAADISGATPRHLVFVRAGSLHRFFVDGKEASRVNVEGSLDWSTDHELFLANSSTLTLPFTGDVHLVAFYAEALSPALIAELHATGLSDPPEPNSPMVFICPDPFIIARGQVDMLAEAAPFAAGEGGGAGLDAGCYESDLRATSWRITANQPLQEGDVRLETLAAPQVCQRRARIYFNPEISEVDLTVELEIVQVPVRGRTETATAAFLLHLPVQIRFRRGDLNGNGSVDISDAIRGLGFLFSGEPWPRCNDAADANDDGTIDVSDPIVILNYLFAGTVEIPPPGPRNCGEDPAGPGVTRDDLDCSVYPDPGAPLGCTSG